jgi:hypothetical protein
MSALDTQQRGRFSFEVRFVQVDIEDSFFLKPLRRGKGLFLSTLMSHHTLSCRGGPRPDAGAFLSLDKHLISVEEARMIA